MAFCFAIVVTIGLIAGSGGIDSSTPALLLKGLIALFAAELAFALMSTRGKPKA